MRAAVLRAPGDVGVEIRDDVELRAGPDSAQVLVRVRATGLCQSDFSAMAGKMPLRSPALLGHEAAGEVVEVGSAVTGLAPGDRVIVCAVPVCGRCPSCVRGEASFCHNFETMFRPHAHHRLGDQPLYAFCNVGSFAELVILSADALIPVSADVPFEVASLVSCAVSTGFGAVANAARLAPGTTALVLGCGGVGMATILSARAAGAATIVAVDPREDKRAAALALGATHVAAPEDLVDVAPGVHGGEGFDYAFEAVGKAATIRLAYDSVRRGGRAVVLGIGGREAVEFSAYELAWSAKTLVGSTYGSGDPRRDFPRILALWRSGRLALEALISSSVPLDGINDSIDAAQAGEGIRHVVTF